MMIRSLALLRAISKPDNRKGAGSLKQEAIVPVEADEEVDSCRVGR